MSSTPSAETLRKAKRNQAFDLRPATGTAFCPLKAREFAIYPVRYAIDESPAKGSDHGPNPLPTGWSGAHLPPLRTRGYTLRQLREGWVYVWDDSAKTLHEYQAYDYRLTRHVWTEAEIGQDERHNPGETRPYLLYPRQSRLLIAFSPLQWTWRLCERMRSAPNEAGQWMRELDLSQYGACMMVPHGAPLRELGSCVADIFVDGQESPRFDSCFVTAKEETENSRPHATAFHEALVRGAVPDQDSALFIALDDPMAVIDDLCMSLHGRWLEIEAHTEEHGNKAQTAALVHRLCGVDLHPFIPSHIAHDSTRILAFTRDAHALLDQEIVAMESSGLENERLLPRIALLHLRDRFRATWNTPPLDRHWEAVVEQWRSTRRWRDDVRYEEAWAYLHERSQELDKLNNHAQRSEQDLLGWLERVGTAPEHLGHDPCHAEQASQLLDTTAAIYSAVGASETGQAWLCRQYQSPTTLAGHALFNFNDELAQLIERLSENFSQYGTLDALGQQRDGSGHVYEGIADTTNVASRVNELSAVLDLPAVQNSRLYRDLSETARQALFRLRHVVSDQARHSWHTISQILLAALDGKKLSSARMLAYSAIQVLAGPELSDRPQLIRNASYPEEFRSWLSRMKSLQQQIDHVNAVLTRPSTAHDRHAARVQLATLEQQRNELMFRRPIAIHGAVVGDYAVSLADTERRNHWLRYLGQDEAFEQLRLKAHNAAAHALRSKHWIDQNMGGTLPLLVAGLNLWNLASSVEDARNDGLLSPDELRVIGANSAYTANALMALWVAPAWNRWGGMTGQVRDKSAALAEVGVKAWLGTNNPTFAKLASKLVIRTMGMAAFGAIAAGVEAWQIGIDIKNATSSLENDALKLKLHATRAWVAAFGLQMFGAISGVLFGFAWVVAKPITIALALIGALYLISSFAANYFKRDGLRLWLYRCSWGLDPQWSNSDEDHQAALYYLHQISLQPSVKTRGVVYALYDKGTPNYRGFWLQLLLPGEVQGQLVYLKPIVKLKNQNNETAPLRLSTRFYKNFLSGHWAPLENFGSLPGLNPSPTHLLRDTQYSVEESARLWQVWIPYHRTSDFDIEISYGAQSPNTSKKHNYLLYIEIENSVNDGVPKSISNTTSSAPDFIASANLKPIELLVPRGVNIV